MAHSSSALEFVFGPLDDAAARLADLRLLHRARLSHADPRRLSGRPRARPAPHRHSRRSADGDRPFHDGVRASVFVRARRAHSRQRRVQAEYLDPGRRALRARRPPPRPRLLDFLCRHQSRRVPGAAGVRHARRGIRLALRFCRRRRRHDHRLSFICSPRRRCRPMPSPDERRRTRRSIAPRWRSIVALLLLFLPVSLFWGIYEQQGNTIVLWASEYTDRHCCSAREIPVTWFQALNPFMIFAFTPFIVALWRRQGAREPSTVAKMAIGCFLAAFAYLLLVAAAVVLRRRASELALAVCLFRRPHRRRTLFVADQPFAGNQSRALAFVVDDDGRVAGDQLYRRISRRLSRHFLVEHDQVRVLPDARDHLRRRRPGDHAADPPVAREFYKTNPAAARHIARPATWRRPAEPTR